MPDEVISETVSEKKRKRGRPKVIPDDMKGTINWLSPSCRTERGKQNVYYRQRAFCLIDGNKHKWLADTEAILTRKGPDRKTFKSGILAELGRIASKQDILEWADILCEKKPNTKDAITMIRRWRLGKNVPDGNADDLHSVILRAMNDYINSHSITWDNVELAIVCLRDSVIQARDKKRISETDSENTET